MNCPDCEVDFHIHVIRGHSRKSTQFCPFCGYQDTEMEQSTPEEIE